MCAGEYNIHSFTNCNYSSYMLMCL
jgi:hypothetical protein